jgi:hypothetical protein
MALARRICADSRAAIKESRKRRPKAAARALDPLEPVDESFISMPYAGDLIIARSRVSNVIILTQILSRSMLDK